MTHAAEQTAHLEAAKHEAQARARSNADQAHRQRQRSAARHHTSEARQSQQKLADAQARLDAQQADETPAITVADVEAAFGPATAKMAAKYNQWPDEAVVRDRLAIIAEHGPRKAKRIIAAGARYEARARKEQYRTAFVH